MTFQKDEVIDTEQYFYIVYQDACKLTVTDDDNHGNLVSSRHAVSGQLFDF
jgi:hypothetical protein